MRIVRKFQLCAQRRYDHQGRSSRDRRPGVRIVLAGRREERVQPVAEAGDEDALVFQERSQNPRTHVQTATAEDVRHVSQKAQPGQLLQVSIIL